MGTSEETQYGNPSIAVGKFNPEPLNLKVDAEMVKSKNQYYVIIKAESVFEENIIDKVEPSLYLTCRSTSYAKKFEGTRNGQTYSFLFRIPAIYLHREIHCQVYLSDKNFDIIQTSNKVYVEIQDKFVQNFPRIIWRSFSQFLPLIKNAYWYISAEVSTTVTVYFNKDIEFFQAAIVRNFSQEFYDLFYVHFRQVYAIALMLGVDNLSEERYTMLDTLDAPYHKRILELVDPIITLAENPWIIFAYMNQIATGAVDQFNKLLNKGIIRIKGVIERDNE